jgi:hypothetical protein
MFETDDHVFPSKPELAKENKKAKMTKFALSGMLFIGLFLSMFSDNYLFILEIIGILLIHEMGHFYYKFCLKFIKNDLLSLFGGNGWGKR